MKTSLPTFSNVLNSPYKYKLQVIYTQINRDSSNNPSFKTYKFNSYKNYFYPASTVKLPVSIVAMVKLQELKDKGITPETSMVTDSAFFCQKKINWDSASATGRPNIAHYIKKMFLVSDNASCARVYEFVGCDYLHQKLEDWDYNKIRITNRLDGGCPGDTAKITPPVYFLGTNKRDTLYKQPLTFATYNKPHPIAKSEAGRAYIGNDGKRVYKPKDFSKHNYLPLFSLHDMMKKLVFNEYLPEKEKLPLNNENRKFLLKYLGMYPIECDHPKYDKKIFYDSYKKYFMHGNAVFTITTDSIRIFNIVGRAYGFLIDCAYIIDFKNKTEFLVTASIYVNEGNVIGNGKYEYELIGLPFLKELSQSLYKYEIERKRQYLPDLNEFNFYGYK